MLGGSGEVDIDGSKIRVGNKDGNYEHAVMGEQLKQRLNDLRSGFDELVKKAPSNPYTAQLLPGFIKCQQALSNLDPILAENTKVN